MKKRIGNDITFTWHIYRKSGESQTPESFTGKDVEVKLISPLQRSVTIEDVSIATGVVTFTFRGKHQVTLGNYVAVLLENKGEDGMVTLDVVNAVTLVPHSYMEEDGDEGDVIEAEAVELTSTISAGGGGGIEQQQADWAQTDDTAVDYIKNKPDLDVFCRKDMANVHTGGYDQYIKDFGESVGNVAIDAQQLWVRLLYPNGELVSETRVGPGNIRIAKNGVTLNLNPAYFQTLAETMQNKVDKVTGKGLSTNDYTDAEKTKLAELENYDDTAVRELIAGKQDTINDLAAIRSGAQAGATAYQKPQTGIPATDLASAVQNDLAAIVGIAEVIPAQASSDNKLVDEDSMNSAIATATATFRGAFNLVTDLHLSVSATHAQIATALATAIQTADNNDYCYVQIPTADATPTEFASVERYKFNGNAWEYEYTLNNSGFTAAQWAAINSYITSGLVAKLSALPTNEELTQALGGKANTSDLAPVATSGNYNDLSDKPTVDDTPTSNSDNLVKSGGVYNAVKDTVKNTRPDLSDRFSVADPNGYIGFEIDKNGNLLSPTIEALKLQVPDNIDKRYNDNIIVADSDGNIAFVIDKNGNILSKSIDDCGKNPFRTKSLYTIGDSLFCSNVWQETCAQALGCLYDANVNTNPEYPTSAGGTNSYMKYMLSTYMRVLNLIKQDVIPNQGKDAIIILGNSNDNIFDFNTNARAYKCDDIIELSELTTENLASVDVSERSLNVAIKLPQVSIGTLLTITQLPVREGDINLNVGWSADGHYDYKIHVVPQTTQEETLAYVMERILEYDYGSVFDVKMSDDSVGFTMGGAFYPAVLFTDIGNTGMQVTTSQSDNVTYYMLKWLNSDDISEWTNTAKWVDGNASSGWKSSIEELQRHYPLAQIAILNCPKIVIDMTDSSMIRPNGTYNQEAFADAILPVIEGVTKRNKDIADYYQVKFIDIWSELGVSANNILSFYPASGNVHTNEQGQKRWGELIAGAIKGWIS